MVKAGRILGAVALLGVVAATTACGDGEPDVVVIEETPGQLAIDYTILGSTDPVVCAAVGATDVELVVYDYPEYGKTVTKYAQCELFTVDIDLYSGVYSADVTLVDAFNDSVSVTSELDGLKIVPDTVLVVNVDFPPGSIL